jgi:hypothetical protein
MDESSSFGSIINLHLEKKLPLPTSRKVNVFPRTSNRQPAEKWPISSWVRLSETGKPLSVITIPST